MKKMLYLLLPLLLLASSIQAESIKGNQIVGKWVFSDIQVKDIEVKPREVKILIAQYINQMDLKSMGSDIFNKIAPVSFDAKHCSFKKDGEIVKKKYSLKGEILTIEGFKPHKVNIVANKIQIYVDLTKSDLSEIGLSKDLLAMVDIQRIQIHLSFIKQ